MNLCKKTVIAISILSGLIFFIDDSFADSAGKKLIVIADQAQVYLEADQRSTIIATLDKGAILTLSSDRKVRKIFNYVYFTSQKTGCTKSGYILDSYVDKLFDVTKVITIQGQSQSLKKSIRSEIFLDDAVWRMNREQLRSVKGKPVHEGQSRGYDILGYQQKILERECLIGYYFQENRFIGAKFTFVDSHANRNQNIVDYKNIKALLAQRYGQPAEDKISWEDPLYRDQIEEWGNAIKMGHLTYFARWETSGAEVLLQLFGTEDEISLEVTYKAHS
ncbi:MAG: hypothetical protein JXB23_16755 [Candidatus Aminicenantes bacterium]|nr:hypothetical protein [Candidatus Aminicenantes bacterium]